MDAKLESLEQSRVRITVDIDAEMLEKAVEQAYRKNAKKINIPGFRKGKAPRRIIEMNYGPDVFLADAVEDLFPQVYKQAAEETGINPVEQPEVDLQQVEQGVGATFVFEVDVYPDLKLGQYKGLAVEREETIIQDEDVTKVLDDLRERNAQLIVSERTTVEHGDFCVIDFLGYVDGQPFSGGAAENQTLEVGSGQFIPGFEEQLIGMEIGEPGEITVTFPEDYPAGQLAGKEAVFQVTVKELKEKSLPLLDDDFAKDLGEHATLDELKAGIRKDLEDDATRRTNEQVENRLLELIAEDSEVEIPQSMLEHQAEHLAQYVLQNARMSGYDQEQYLERTGQSKEEFANSFQPQAKTQIIHDLILEAVNKQEGITVSEEEVDNSIEEYVGSAGDSDSELRSNLREYWNGRRSMVESTLFRKKALEFIVAHAQIRKVGES